jgi:hypothetical protein
MQTSLRRLGESIDRFGADGRHGVVGSRADDGVEVLATKLPKRPYCQEANDCIAAFRSFNQRPETH